jgi:hypothetical protein
MSKSGFSQRPRKPGALSEESRTTFLSLRLILSCLRIEQSPSVQRAFWRESRVPMVRSTSVATVAQVFYCGPVKDARLYSSRAKSSRCARFARVSHAREHLFR